MRGRRPVVAIESARRFAERQGYRWMDNPDRDMPFDAFLYRGNDSMIIRVKSPRNAPGEYDMFEDFFRDEYEILDSLPFPPYIWRELWVRYVWSRSIHRFRIFDNRFGETTMIDREPPVFQLRSPTGWKGPAPKISRKDERK
jgi:hypothetical protein